MPGRTYAVIQKKLELRRKALAANNQELPHLEMPRVKLDEVLNQVKDLTAQQASLTAAKQEVSKRLAESMREGEILMAFLDAGVKQHYGNRSEKTGGVRPATLPQSAAHPPGRAGRRASEAELPRRRRTRSPCVCRKPPGRGHKPCPFFLVLVPSRPESQAPLSLSQVQPDCGKVEPEPKPDST